VNEIEGIGAKPAPGKSPFQRIHQMSAWLQQRPALRDHMGASLLATVLFTAWFCKALFGGYTYGALTRHQQMGVTWRNPWLGQKELSVTEREPNTLDPDYHFLYEPNAAAAKRDLEAGHLPYMDFSRMLGVPLWGSLVYDFGNPINLLLRFFSVDRVHLIKVLFCMLLAANGFAVLLRELGAKGSMSWAVATATYLSTNYLIFNLHWAGAFGVICVAPLVLGLILRFLRTGRASAFLGLCLSISYLVVANCTQFAFHFAILCTAAVVIKLLFAGREWKRLLPRVVLLGLAAVCAAATSFEVLWQVNATANDVARPAARASDHGYPIIPIPGVPEAYSTFFFSNISGGSYTESVFLPWAAITSILALFCAGGKRRCEVRVLGWLLVFFLFYFFVGWIDAPLYLIGRLYAPNPTASRGALNLYLPLSALAGLGSEKLLSGPASKPTRSLAWVGISIAVVLGGAALCSDPFVLRTFFAGSGLFFDSYIKSTGFWLVLGGNSLWLVGVLLPKKIPFRPALIAIGAFAICAGTGTSRLPFYLAKDISRIPNNDVFDVNAPRVARLVPNIGLIFEVQVGSRYVNDAPLRTFGMKTLTGYHTSMSKQELRVFNSLASGDYLQMETEDPLNAVLQLRGMYVFLDGHAVLENNKLRPRSLLLLKLLGVRYVFDGLRLAETDPQPPFDFNKWPRTDTQEVTACHFVKGASERDIYSLFANSLPNDKVAKLSGEVTPLRLEPTADHLGFQAHLNGVPGLDNVAGTVVIPYHFGRFFKVTLDGQEVPEKDELGLCIVETTPQSRLLEIRPQSSEIAKRIAGGLLVGCLLTLGGCLVCNRLAKGQPPDAENPETRLTDRLDRDGNDAAVHAGPGNSSETSGSTPDDNGPEPNSGF
jgi:hypothetical protein